MAALTTFSLEIWCHLKFLENVFYKLQYAYPQPIAHRCLVVDVLMCVVDQQCGGKMGIATDTQPFHDVTDALC